MIQDRLIDMLKNRPTIDNIKSLLFAMQSTRLNAVQLQIVRERINTQVQSCNVKAAIHIRHDVDTDDPPGHECCRKAECGNALSATEVKDFCVSEASRSAPIGDDRGNINKSTPKEWILHSCGG